jgi:hypothetical protein
MQKTKKNNHATANPVPLPNCLIHHWYTNSSKDSEHNHKPLATRIGVATALRIMRNKAKDHVSTKSCQIIQDTINESSAKVVRNLPSVQAVQRAQLKIEKKYV